jgi:hypothetical protein
VQGITTAISTRGIEFFGRELIGSIVAQRLSEMKIDDRDIPVKGFNIGYSNVRDLVIRLRNGKLAGFTPQFSTIAQRAGGEFDIVMTAPDFDVDYAWNETYKYTSCSFVPKVGIICKSPVNRDRNFAYRPRVRQFVADVKTAFAYSDANKAYEVRVTSKDARSNPQANIPGDSIINREEQGCFTSQVSEATKSAIGSVDFKGAIGRVMPELIRSIPASGKLTDNITFEFALGDDRMTFPNNAGIAIAATGRARWKNEQYQGTEPKLPVPTIPTDKHLRSYVSDYAINGLYWAYFKDGGLGATVTPSDLPNPDVLRVDTYVETVPALAPYAGKVMYAKIDPKTAPVTTFQEVWLYDKRVLAALEASLPADVYKKVKDSLGNRAYTTEAEARTAVGRAVPADYVERVLAAAKQVGAVVAADINFRLTIQDTDPAAYLEFSVKRVDVLRDLGLGTRNEAQTLTFEFARVKATATFVSTNIPDFDDEGFGRFIWPVVGETEYVKLQEQLGKIGVPIPIMQGFSFLFESAQLRLANGYVEITSDVRFKKAALPALVVRLLELAA